MKKLKESIILIVLIIAIMLSNQYVYANSTNIDIDKIMRKVDYSNNYEKWIELSENEKKYLIQPKMYDDLNTKYMVKNPFYQIELVGTSLNSKYSLKDIIPSNVAIRNQYETQSCWAFSGLSSLETNLALNNYKLGKNLNKVYDFSERHANYATSRMFLNGSINEYGYNRSPETGGSFVFVESYLTNGTGAIEEKEMPFENNSNLIDISNIQNKEVKTRVYDTVYFNNYNELNGTSRINEMNEIKQHIQNYGSVFATIHGGMSDMMADNCYNNDTGAKYCNDEDKHFLDHVVSIIGWDDDYSIDNFSDELKPTSKGAWIVRNSWGEELEYDLDKLKEELFVTYKSMCISKGWNSPQEIPNSLIENAGFKITDNKVSIEIGDKGYMYVSYEDCNIGGNLFGITKASDSVDYDYLYQYNETYPVTELAIKNKNIFLCNVFDKKSNGKEYLTSVSLNAIETYNCKVYVNPTGDSKNKSDLKQVKLVAGDFETIDKGYHTLEFATPIEITGDKFVVVIEIEGTRSEVDILLEGKIDGIDLLNFVKTEKGKCYVASSNSLDNCQWIDLGTIGDIDSNFINGDSSIKAFTVNHIEDESLNRIEISVPPTKTKYVEGEDFDKSGMKVKAFYNNNTDKILEDSDYSIENGTNLKVNQTSVTIKYSEKTVEQPITVEKKVETKPEEKPADKEENPEVKPETKPEVKPENCDFSKAKSNLISVKGYSYTDKSKKSYIIVDTEITGINRKLTNDSNEYYYYLSENANLKEIKDWIKIKETQSSTDKLRFLVDSRNLPNYDELSKADNIYLYVKEVATKGGNQSIAMSKALTYDMGNAKINLYLDDEQFLDFDISDLLEIEETDKDNNKNNSSNNNNSNNNNSGNKGGTTTSQGGTTSNPNSGSTMSPVNLPHTGNGVLIVVIAIIVGIGLVAFIRYEILNKSLK